MVYPALNRLIGRFAAPEVEPFIRDPYRVTPGTGQVLGVDGTIRTEVAEAGHAPAVWQASVYCGLDEIGGEERERDRHVDFTRTATLPCGDGFGGHVGTGDNFIQPESQFTARTAPAL